AGDFSARTHPQGCDEGVHSRAAAEVHNDLTRLEAGQVEVIADTCEGLDRLRRHAIEIRRRIAETFSHRTAHLEVEISMRIFGDAAIHRLDLCFELLRVEQRDCHRRCLLYGWTASPPSATDCNAAVKRAELSDAERPGSGLDQIIESPQSAI